MTGEAAGDLPGAAPSQTSPSSRASVSWALVPMGGGGPTHLAHRPFFPGHPQGSVLLSSQTWPVAVPLSCLKSHLFNTRFPGEQGQLGKQW